MKKFFFRNDARIVAKELLGKYLVRKLKSDLLISKIVEVECYYDFDDPASRARFKGDLAMTMQMDGGTILVYGVHNNWMLNFVTGKKGQRQGVLIRSVEPINFDSNTKGPGLLTRALNINKSFHKKSITECEDLYLLDSKIKYAIGSSHRIGVSKDLNEKLRFFITGNSFVTNKNRI